MSKIVIDARIIKSSTGRYIERLLHYLQKIDRVNHYAVLVRDKHDWKPTSKNFVAVHAPYADFSFDEQLKLKRLLKKLKPDLVHFTMPQYPILYRGKRINTIHDLTMLNFKHRHWNAIVDGLKRIVFRLVFFMATRATYIITPTRYTKTLIVKRYRVDPSRVVVTYESADKLAVAPKEYRPMKGKKFIFYVGNVTPYKNITRLIQAFDLVKSKQPDLHLLIVGRAGRYHAELESLIEHDGVKNVHLTGYIPDEQLAWLYHHAVAYVFPSLSEGFGLPGLEAMQYDTPVISSNATCLPEVYKDAADYFDPLSIEDMAAAINRVVSSANLRKKLVAAGKTQREKYSWLTMAQQTKEIYDKVLS